MEHSATLLESISGGKLRGYATAPHVTLREFRVGRFGLLRRREKGFPASRFWVYTRVSIYVEYEGLLFGEKSTAVVFFFLFKFSRPLRVGKYRGGQF